MPKYWQADKYFEWQDEVWDAPGARKGRVEVGDVEQAAKVSPSEDKPQLHPSSDEWAIAKLAVQSTGC